MNFFKLIKFGTDVGTEIFTQYKNIFEIKLINNIKSEIMKKLDKVLQNSYHIYYKNI